MRMRTALVAAGLWVLLAVPVQASTLIDTAPFDWEFSYAEFSGPDTAGGTFTAVEPRRALLSGRVLFSRPSATGKSTTSGQGST